MVSRVVMLPQPPWQETNTEARIVEVHVPLQTIEKLLRLCVHGGLPCIVDSARQPLPHDNCFQHLSTLPRFHHYDTIGSREATPIPDTVTHHSHIYNIIWSSTQKCERCAEAKQKLSKPISFMISWSLL